MAVAGANNELDEAMRMVWGAFVAENKEDDAVDNCDEAHFAPVCVIRRKIELYLHDLYLLEAEEERQSLIGAFIGGEFALAGRILCLERQMMEHRSDCNNTSLPSSVRRTVREAEYKRDASALILMMRHSIYLYSASVQLCIARALRKIQKEMMLRDEQQKWQRSFVNAGGLDATVNAMRNHKLVPSLQKIGAILLLTTPFVKKGAPVQTEQSLRPRQVSESTCCRHAVKEMLDLDAVRRLLDIDALEVVGRAALENLFGVSFMTPNDTIGDYERTLARNQLPALCASAKLIRRACHICQNPVQHDDPLVASERHFLAQRMGVLRTCLASLLTDDSIAPERLSSFLHRRTRCC